VISHTLRHTVGLLWTSDHPVADTSTYTGQHNRQTSMPRTRFEPATPATAYLRLRPRGHCDRPNKGHCITAISPPNLLKSPTVLSQFLQKNQFSQINGRGFFILANIRLNSLIFQARDPKKQFVFQGRKGNDTAIPTIPTTIIQLCTTEEYPEPICYMTTSVFRKI
jgi:hypothetical protein